LKQLTRRGAQLNIEHIFMEWYLVKPKENFITQSSSLRVFSVVDVGPHKLLRSRWRFGFHVLLRLLPVFTKLVAQWKKYMKVRGKGKIVPML